MGQESLKHIINWNKKYEGAPESIPRLNKKQHKQN